MKTTSTFKLNRAAKRMIALTYNNEMKKIFKNAFIEAQVTEEHSRSRRTKESEESS